MSALAVLWFRVRKQEASDGASPGGWVYVVAVLSVVLAGLLRAALDPHLRDFQPFPTFYIAVACVAWRYSWRPAVLAQILGYLVGDWFFSAPRISLRLLNLAQTLELVMYFLVTTTVILLIHFMRRAQRRSEAALRLAREKERELEADIAERRRLEAALTRREEELEQLVQERTTRLRETIGDLEAFSYSITHDMRAPLRAMQGFTAMLEQECAGCPRPGSQDLFRRIKVASRRLDQLITDALDYNKLMRDELSLKPVWLNKLLEGMVETYLNLQPPQANVRIELSDLSVMGNEAALTQCFSNLLGNAVKFVAPGVTPQVRVWAEPMPAPIVTPASGLLAPPRALVRVWVEDNGIGIPKEAHDKIFGMFQRLHRADEYPGTGIGLAMVRKAAERMGGRVGVESEAGHGSRFWVELIRAPAP